MVFGLLKRKKKQPNQYWTDEEAGYEKSRSVPVISHLLAHLKNKRTSLTLVAKGYQSGATFLLEVKDEEVQIDLPSDWPMQTSGDTGDKLRVRVIFKDAAQKWNHFDVRITGKNENTLFLSRPQTIYRLERRAHFRVAAPNGAKITFTCENNRIEEAILNDLSAGGMSFSMPETLKIKEKLIKDINIVLPGDDAVSKHIRINQGEIVRFSRDMISKLIAFGVSFQVSNKEEETLLQIVRQHELSQLQQPRQQYAAAHMP